MHSWEIHVWSLGEVQKHGSWGKEKVFKTLRWDKINKEMVAAGEKVGDQPQPPMSGEEEERTTETERRGGGNHRVCGVPGEERPPTRDRQQRRTNHLLGPQYRATLEGPSVDRRNAG